MDAKLSEPAHAAVGRPTRIRHRVVGMTLLLATVTYFDRICISVLAPHIMRDLGLTKMQMSFVFSIFMLSYAAFEIPTAWWADRAGTRRVLTRIVLWWSTFTIATAAAWNYAVLLATRFLFGVGEAGAWPSVARTFSQWIPRRERGTVQGIFFMGAHLSGGLTPLLVMYLLTFYHWRQIFALLGSLGFVWAFVWYRWFRDHPAEHPQANAAELAYILADRETTAEHHVGWQYWKRLFANRNVAALCLMYVPNVYAFYFCITWLPTYLLEKHGFTSAALGIAAGLPLALSVLSDVFGGLTTDWAVVRFGARLGRSGIGVLGYVVSGLAAFLAAGSPHPMAAAVLISVSTAALMFTLAAAWGTCLDIGGNHAGVVSATMNTCGQVGSIINPILVTLLVQQFNDWNAPLYLLGAISLFGAACWCFIDPRRPVFG